MAEAVENSERMADLKDIVGEYMLPVILGKLRTNDAITEDKAQRTLIQIIKRNYVSKFQAEVKICPTVLALTKMATQPDIYSVSVTLMNKLAPLLGTDITERIFLKRYIELCSSDLFYVRKLTASHIGEYCSVLGKQSFEKELLPCYLKLCQDEVWGVRKACAEVIIFVSSVCPPELRKSLLAPAFSKLLQDDWRWVQYSAYQSLGGFITTFANPAISHIEHNTIGELVLLDKDGNEYRPGEIEDVNIGGCCCSLKPGTRTMCMDLPSFLEEYGSRTSKPPEIFDPDELFSMVRDKKRKNWLDTIENKISEDKPVTQLTNVVKKTSVGNDEELSKHGDQLLNYNEYNYWYISPPEVNIEDLLDMSGLRLDDLDDSAEDIVTDHSDQQTQSTPSPSSSTVLENPCLSAQLSGDNNGDTLDSQSSPVIGLENIAPKQEHLKITGDIVPQDLIESFLSMAQDDEFRECDRTFLCAYAFPAVVLTLGKENWPLLKDTFNTLAECRFYKIRRAVAGSLHEIASVIGKEQTSEDLAPVFQNFFKDLDEVRIGLLKNLSQFLKQLSTEKLVEFLPQLQTLLQIDFSSNWRFHETFAHQLIECISLCEPEDARYFGVYAIILMTGKVAAVRQAAVSLGTEVMKYLAKDNCNDLVTRYMTRIVEQIAHAKKWRSRQMFVIFCTEILKQDALDEEKFASVALPHLLDLSWDPVVNVRLVVAKCLVQYIITKVYFMDPENGHVDTLQNVLRRLQADKDRDVRVLTNVPEVQQT